MPTVLLKARRPHSVFIALLVVLLAAPIDAQFLVNNNTGVGDDVEMTVTAAAYGDELSSALAVLVRLALERAGMRARSVPPPKACERADSAPCLAALLRMLVRGEVWAALVPVGARAPPAPLMRDAGLEEMGEAAPSSRRACFAAGGSGGPVRSLLDLADPRLAAIYHVDDFDLNAVLNTLSPSSTVRTICDTKNCTKVVKSENAGTQVKMLSATILVGEESEAVLMADVARQWRLHARFVPLGARMLPVIRSLLTARSTMPLLLCAPDNSPAVPPTARLLGPPPCTGEDCPFETRRLVKLVNARRLAREPTVYHVLARLALDQKQVQELEERARHFGPETAAREFVAARPNWAGPPREVRVAVMIPATTRRDAYQVCALQAAAILVERDVLNENAASNVRFKVELVDDGCTATLAFKFLTDALGSEFGALSGVAGPACGSAFADVARQAPALRLPVIAYTSQTAPGGTADALTLLAAGDSKRQIDALAALLPRLRWRRLAVLSELATRYALDVTRLHADILVHVELTHDGDEVDWDAIFEWAERAARANSRVLLVYAEDSRVVAAALCAGSHVGLTPTAGAVWLLPGGWVPNAALVSPPGRPSCEPTQLRATAAGHLSVVPAWLVRWDPTATLPHRAWAARWTEVCTSFSSTTSSDSCARAPPHAALLYDALRIWAAALHRLLITHPAALDDLHRGNLAESIVNDATKNQYIGLTGEFVWTAANGARARDDTLIVRQWINDTAIEVGQWRADVLTLEESKLIWFTADGHTPDDGGDQCALRPLADLLGGDCRAAFVAVATLAPAVALVVLAAVAWHCRRRAEREHRARLAELSLRTFTSKPASLDRWEVPRERVVINRKLGTGAFGTVYGGLALINEERGWIAVAVKTLKTGTSMEEKLDFLSEAEAMKRFDHKNIVRLLGVITKTEPVCTVMEFMLYGDLKNYLLARRHLVGVRGSEGSEDGVPSDEVSAGRLTSMALDVAHALSYLAQLRYVHRDVAARNCLVSTSRVVKLADFGMTRPVNESDYYRFSRKGLLPVRWMAPESLALGMFSPSSDVWSFGVLLYEIVTFGALPFQGLSNAEVLVRVKAGRALDLPPGLRPQLEGLIKLCWQRERRSRPPAAEVVAFLADSPRLLTPCVDVPIDALALDSDNSGAERDAELPWDVRWASWVTPPSTATETTYLSTDALPSPPAETDAFLP